MENRLPHQTKILSMEISCCERCPKILNKKLLKMPGVDSVAIDKEKDLVYVTGIIDATTLLNNVVKLGKPAQLLPSHNFESRLGNGKFHKNCCCEDGRHSSSNKQQQVEEREAHKCEAYIPPSVDARVCRDFFCKTHPRGRIIVDKVPAESSSFFALGNQRPFYGGYYPYGGGSNQYPGWYGAEPHQFGYGQPPMNLSYRTFGPGYQ